MIKSVEKLLPENIADSISDLKLKSKIITYSYIVYINFDSKTINTNTNIDLVDKYLNTEVIKDIILSTFNGDCILWFTSIQGDIYIYLCNNDTQIMFPAADINLFGKSKITLINLDEISEFFNIKKQIAIVLNNAEYEIYEFCLKSIGFKLVNKTDNFYFFEKTS